VDLPQGELCNLDFTTSVLNSPPPG
jgi:hypothetical protein